MSTGVAANDVSYKVGFMFPGQGAQTVGMASQLCAELPAAKDLFDRASKILGYRDYPNLIFNILTDFYRL